LAVGIPGFDFGSTKNAGIVAIINTGAFGLTSYNPTFFSQNTANIVDTAETGDFFGYSLKTGDYNGDGRDDLVVGASLENIGNLDNVGVIHVLYGSNTGLKTVGSQYFSQSSFGILGTATANDEFGAAFG
jgi:hypothetical protein